MLFDDAVKIIIELEGGFVDHPKDTGGMTKFGISKKAHPNVDIKNLTLEQAKQIYKDKYWNPNRMASIPHNWRLIYFDAIVNHGALRATKLLQLSLKVKPDGIAGPKTRAAMRDGDPITLFLKRLAFYTTLKNSNAFLKGWITRLLHIMEH